MDGKKSRSNWGILTWVNSALKLCPGLLIRNFLSTKHKLVDKPVWTSPSAFLGLYYDPAAAKSL